MEILAITIAAPRADQIGTPADEANDGWFAKLLQASDERPDFREPAREAAPEPDRAADDRAAAAQPADDGDAEAAGEPPAYPEQPADKASATGPIGSPTEQRVAIAGQPAAKLPPVRPATGTRTGAGQGGQITAATPAEKTSHGGPPPTVVPATANAGAAAGTSVAPTAVSGHNPAAVPEPGAAAPAAPPPQARIKPQTASRPKGPGAEPPGKPAGTGEGAAAGRKEPAVTKTAAARSKAGAEGVAPRQVQNLQQSLGALPGLTAANPGPGANRAPAQQPGTTAATLGPGQSAANGSLALAEARPAAPPAAPPGSATEQVALRIHKAVAGGQERISIKLHPAELGRIEVKLAWSDDGLMRAMISADKGETLELLQRDSRALERTLQDAGVKTDSGSLSFDLRGQGGRGEAADDRGPQSADGDATEGDETERSDSPLAPAANHRAHRGLLDLSV